MKAKFEIGQNVLALEANKCREVKITGISSNIGKTLHEGFLYYVDDCYDSFKESELFSTKDELLNSIFGKDE